jgi:hypothetical protein
VTRRIDWEERLNAVVAEAQGRAFEWGEHDCAMFAARCADAVADLGLEAWLRASYRDARSALEMCGGDLQNLPNVAAERLGESVPPLLAARGDIVAHHDVGDRPTLGVCLGHVSAFAADGLEYRPTASCTHVWRI